MISSTEKQFIIGVGIIFMFLPFVLAIVENPDNPPSFLSLLSNGYWLYLIGGAFIIIIPLSIFNLFKNLTKKD